MDDIIEKLKELILRENQGQVLRDFVTDLIQLAQEKDKELKDLQRQVEHLENCILMGGEYNV